MISRLTAFAATFALLVAASLGFAASAHQSAVAAVPAKAVRVVQLERVVIVAKRNAAPSAD